MPGREIFIGDIQGCFDEFMLLLEKLEYVQGQDSLFLVGDVISRGPKSHEVLDYLLEHPEINVVRGNHEQNLLDCGSLKKARKKSKLERLVSQLEPRYKTYCELMESWPFFLESDDWILVHAGIVPGLSLQDQDPNTLIHIRDLPDEPGVPWFERYEGDKLVIYGHWAIRGLVVQGRVRGLDSGCVYGGKLSALVLPEDEIVSVPALKMHYDPIKNRENW